MSEPRGLTAEYDALDRPVALHHPLAGTARRVYDADGRIGQVVYPDDPTYGFPSGIVVSYLYDARGQLAGILDPTAGLWRFVHDEAGRLTRRIDPSASGTEQHIRYRPEGFVHEITLKGPGGIEHERLHYEAYDARGNPTRFHTKELGYFAETGVAYDARGQVTRVEYPDVDGITVFAEEFGYDLAGNRTRHVGRDGVARTHGVDAASQLEEIRDEATGALLVSFVHDGAGRRSERIEGGVTTRYTYDGLGRLLEVDPDDATPGDETVFEYDVADHRSSWTGPTDARTYFGEWLEVHGMLPAATTRRLVHGGGIDRVVGEVDELGTARSYYPDAARNVTHVGEFSEAGGFALEPSPRRYEAFGALREGSSAVDRGFAGRPVEGDTGLVYLRARHYDPATGRFLQTDPLGVASEQLYAYARSNPFVFGDPLGLEAEENSEGREGDVSRGVSVGSIVGGAVMSGQGGGPVNGIHEMSSSVVSLDSRSSSGSRTTSTAGAIAGGTSTYASAGEFSHVRNGEWRGVNGKWNALDWGGNQWTGGRTAVQGAATSFRGLSKGFFFVGTGVSFLEGGAAALEGDLGGVGKAGADVAFGYLGIAAGPWGALASGTYWAVDITVGWGWMPQREVRPGPVALWDGLSP